MFNSVPMAAPAPMAYPAPTYRPQPNSMPAAVAVPASAPRPAAPARPKPLVRAQAPEEPNPARPPLLTMPSPEQLGVSLRPVEKGPDWTALHARMEQLGIISHHAELLPDGRARFTCWVPRGQPGLTRRIEVVAASQSEAMQLALQQADQMRAAQP
jgi:hypothetical protein